MAQKTFIEMGLNEFVSQTHFTDLWKKHVDKLVSSSKDRHQRRIEMIAAFPSVLGLQAGGQSSFEINLKCEYLRSQLQSAIEGVWFRNCNKIHVISILTVYQLIKGRNVKTFNCPLCKDGSVSSTKDIHLNIIIYQYFELMEEQGKGMFKIVCKGLGDQEIRALGDARKTDNDTFIEAERKHLIFRMSSFPKQFTQLIMDYKVLDQQFQQWRDMQDDDSLSLKIPEDRRTRISLICPFSKKRILLPIVHKKCIHTQIILFDFCSILIYLGDRSIQRKQPIKCPKCDSAFTVENIFQQSLSDINILNWLVKEPMCFTNIYFAVHRNHTPKQEDQIRGLTRNIESSKLTAIQKKVKSFFRTDHRKKYDGYIKIISEKLIGQEVVEFTPSFSQNPEVAKISIPVRCIKCSMLNVLDLWDYFNKIVITRDEQEKNCPICGFKHKASQNSEKFIYFDFKLWELTKIGITNILFYPREKIYAPSIIDLGKEQFIQYLTLKNKLIHEYGPNTLSFEIQGINIPNETLKTSVPIIFEQCLAKDANRNWHILYKHTVFLTKDLQLRELTCPCCKTKANKVDDMNIDNVLMETLKKGVTKLEYLHNIKNYRERQKITSLTKDQLFQIVQQQVRYDIGQIVKLNIKKSTDQVIVQPVLFKGCKPGAIHIMDLVDIFGKTKLTSCPECKVNIEYVDQLEFLPSIKEAIKELLDNLRLSSSIGDSLSKGIVCKAKGMRKYQATILPGSEKPPVSIYDKILSPKGIILKKDKYKKQLDKLKDDFRDKYEGLPHDDQSAADFKLPEVRTAGGIYIARFKPIPRFDPNM